MKANKILIDRIKGRYIPVVRPIRIYIGEVLAGSAFKNQFRQIENIETNPRRQLKNSQ